MAQNGLLDFLQGASNSAASTVSAPVDGLAWLLRKAGAKVGDNPIGGSDWMRAQGLTQEPQNKLMGLLGEAAGGVAPMVAGAYAPQIAKGLLGMADNLAAPQVLRKESGMFIGPSAKTWDATAASKAQQMAAKGVDPRKVWSETGTWKGPDGAWRQEIPDNAAGLRLNSPKFGTESMSKASDVYAHKSLFDAYPDAENINVTWNKSNGGGSFTAPREYAQYIDLPQGVGAGSMNTPKSTNSVAMHEMQHAIQQREGFERGGSAEEFSRIYETGYLAELQKELRQLSVGGWTPEIGAKSVALNKKISGAIADPYATYKNLAGEAEARATQARIPLDASQRRALFPEDSYDVPMNQLIVRGLLGK